MLLLADVVGLTLAFLATELIVVLTQVWPVDLSFELALFLATLPIWALMAKIYGLYDRDEERTDHSTVEDSVGVFHLVTVGAWLLYVGARLSGLEPPLWKLVTFWALAVVLVMLMRSLARAFCHRHPAYVQNTILVGAGDVGQLIARKLIQHREYGLNLVGFVDTEPREPRGDLGEITLLGTPGELPELVQELKVERVVIAFSNESAEDTIALVRSLRELDVQVDIVPRLFDVLGPRVNVHTVESLPLIGLPPARMPRSSRLLKRGFDLVGASLGLVLTAPLFAYVSWRIKRGSRGPVFFRQTRLGKDMREFTAFKFRTMKIDTDASQHHREFIKSTMSPDAEAGANGLYKPTYDEAITGVGRWLRRTSLDELPQLVNVLRGEMSLVGPRPCIPYEVEHFAPHHFERFLVPAGMTGLWQVTARAHSTFGEALDMDVAYARGWSLGLDLRLLCRTPLLIFRGGDTA